MTRSFGQRTLAGALLLAGLAGGLAGCAADPRDGYSTMSLYPDEVRTIAIPIFENKTFSRGVEFDLTNAVIQTIETRTPYKVVTRDRADTILLGQITEVELDQLSKSRQTGLGEEVVVTMTIDFQWRMLDLDRTLVDRKSFTGHGLFTPSNPSSERIELGEYGAIAQLAHDLVDEMQAAW